MKMRELSKVEMEQISGGCLTDIVTGVNTVVNWFTTGLQSLFTTGLQSLFSSISSIFGTTTTTDSSTTKG
ncbi:hypothetical protein [Xylella fastidiosa]|uniref:Bacteriocin n=3 Tax=Xylella fastidiosa TaxID=2371 RepID=A0AAW6HUN9_XYLFS|nr:hypothetical protein [Xylella fastidiosa]KAJ4852222.1 hypothetical protein XYFPCFBP8418_010115 [Xylella fastidiosa subsp. multiplex]MCP8325600.1 hypothetical protein [Xylella fastidiosa subsp. multiplex]MDC6408310.1 hypothetical protein [Xylella fastidiosa subsp. multiplex]MDC6411573.1 hypothetical protein [Xylella fastidiosa subsp. multiplex]MDC6414046.1 hypothetical protein [Xylella fastidiosa subsp. multiplex]